MLTWDDTGEASHGLLALHKIIIRRNGAVVLFEPWVLSDLFGHWARHLSRLNHLMQSTFAKPLNTITKTPPMKLSGFFSSSKANLRNAP